MKKKWEKILSLEIKPADIDLAGGLLAVVFAVVAFVATLGTKSFSNSVIGPKTVPQIFSAIVFVLGWSIVIRWVVKRGKAKNVHVDQIETKGDQPIDQKMIFQKITPLVSFLLLALYIFLMKPIGFTFSSIIYLTLQIPLLSADLSGKTILKAFKIAILASVCTYLLFALGFGLKLPKGIMGF